MVHDFEIRCVVRSHGQISGVAIDHWRTHLCVRIDYAVNAVANSHIIRCHWYLSVLTLVKSQSFIYCSYHHCAISAVADLEILHIGVNVNITILTPNNSHILILQSLIFHCHTFIQAIHIYYFIFWLIRRNHLPKPVHYNILVNLNWVIADLEERSQWGKRLRGASLCSTCLLNFK